MGFFSSATSSIAWRTLDSVAQLDEILELSKSQPVLIFKHSTRCSISAFAKKELEMDWNSDLECTCFYLDLIAYREVSNAIESKFKVQHQSPQAILIINQEVVYTASHQSISAEKISTYL